MTADEFNTALMPHLIARFTQIDFWIGKLPFDREGEHDRRPTQKEMLKTWRLTLADLSLQDAIAAVDEMYRAEEPPPNELGEYPRRILSTARRLRNVTADRTYKPTGRMVDGERVYRCRVSCKDDGVIVVWHPLDHKAARERPEEFIAGTIQAYTCIIPCSCRAGDAMMHFYPKTLIRYSPDGNAIRVPEYGSMKPMEMRRQLVEILAERDASTPRRGKQAAFDCDAPGRYEDENGFPT